MAKLPWYIKCRKIKEGEIEFNINRYWMYFYYLKLKIKQWQRLKK